MGRSKELYIEAHEAAIEAYLEAHPDASEEEAYEATGEQAWNDMGDMMADRADHYYQQMKDARNGN
jgi:hypothetical protein